MCVRRDTCKKKKRFSSTTCRTLFPSKTTKNFIKGGGGGGEREGREEKNRILIVILRATPKKKNGDKSPGQPFPSLLFEKKKVKREKEATGLGDDTRTGVLPGVLEAQGAFEDWMARWFPRFASRIAFRCVLHPRESRDIRRRELFRVIYLFFRSSFLFFFSPLGGEKKKNEVQVVFASVPLSLSLSLSLISSPLSREGKKKKKEREKKKRDVVLSKGVYNKMKIKEKERERGRRKKEECSLLFSLSLTLPTLHIRVTRREGLLSLSSEFFCLKKRQ